MPQVINIQKEMDNRTFLEGRHVDTPPEELEAAFATLAHYRDGGIFAGGFSGVSRWERHRNGDEIVHVLGGATLLTIMRQSDAETFELTAGMMIIVPQGCWHRFESETGVQLMTVTPQPTDHTGADDPTDTNGDHVTETSRNPSQGT